MIEITSAGPLTTVQDAGRTGCQSAGFTPSGAADLVSARLANVLAGNYGGEAVLEMTLMGITAVFGRDCVIALAGADMTPEINGSRAENNRAYEVKAGDTLKMGFAASGCRCYLAVNGGIAVPEVMGNRSTSLKLGIGGFSGRKLAAGDLLPLADPKPSLGRTSERRVEYLPPSEKVRALFVPGLQEEMFTEAGRAAFYGCEYTVSPASDRMGIRLEGTASGVAAAIEAIAGYDIISDGITAGAVQIPPSGQPIILLADRQTTGGYAKIGAVATVSLPDLAQLKPGGKVSFQAVTVREAQALLIKREKRFAKLRKQMQSPEVR